MMGSVSVPVSMPERYEQLAELGHGGMGVVYKVRDRETTEILALKFLKSEIAQDQQILERFKNELRLAHKITHRNVARLYEFHRVGAASYLSMEFIEGESLRAFIKARPKVELTRALEIARQLAAGLAEAHRQSIAHRDLKPENVMLTPEGEVKVMDFGISRSYGAGATTTGAILGTPAYMSPEQAGGKPADHRSDIYSFGLILYEMVTGVQAFTGETPISVALKQIQERPETPRKLDPSVPKHVERAILRCLEKNPADRFQSIQEALAALEGETVTLQRPKTRSRKWIGITAAIVVLAGAALAYLWWRGGASDSVQIPIERFTLANGLPVVLSVDHATPVITLGVAYRTGAYSDPPGREGLGHVVSHLMFQGSANVAPGEHFSLIQSVGGQANDTNFMDSDVFWTTLPANQLELGLFLEADRMGALEITPEGLDDARNTLIEEYRTRVTSSLYGSAHQTLRELVFSNPRNRRGLYGNPDAVKTVTVDEARGYYQAYYVPSNVGLALVGDFDPKQARTRIEHYFGSIPARPAPPAPDLREPERKAEVRKIIAGTNSDTTTVMVAWCVPPPSDLDWIVLYAIANLLNGNEASRLTTSLVKGSGVATAVTAQIDQDSGSNLFVISSVAAPGKEPSQVETAVLQEIDRIAREGVPQDEMERLFTDMSRGRVFSLVTTMSRGFALAKLLAVQNYPEGINNWESKLHSITNESLRRVIAKYFTPANRTVLYVVPPGAER
jgi:predicted Zn-dependent peptidase/predicted Ser/Thr protein kinase